MLEDEQFDVFLAYYGNSQNGSENAARELYNFLSNQRNVNGHPLRVYFHPETKKYGQYGHEVLYETTFHKDGFRKKSGKYFSIDYGYRV